MIRTMVDHPRVSHPAGARAIRAALLLSLALLPIGARADFHPACSGTPPTDASVSLRNVSSGYSTLLQFSGKVTCGGADSITINSLTLSAIVPPGAPRSAAPATCTSQCETVEVVDQAAGTPGIYELEMHFTVTKETLTFTPSRLSRYAWLGAGDPIKIG